MKQDILQQFARIQCPRARKDEMIASMQFPLVLEAVSPCNFVFHDAEQFPLLETARAFLMRMASPDAPTVWQVHFQTNPAWIPEEFSLTIAADFTVTAEAGEVEGLRRALYFLADQLASHSGAEAVGHWHRKPAVQNRISRCFFAPTGRPPLGEDELLNEVDYYPEEYLQQLAYEGINGLWLTMYFRDFPSSVLDNHASPTDAQKRFAKLRRVVDKCARYGIRIYVFFSEPKLIGDPYFALPEAFFAKHPELAVGDGGTRRLKFFCTEEAAGTRYLEESVHFLFRAVPRLGGIINIMCGEDSGSCAAMMLERPAECICPYGRNCTPSQCFAHIAAAMSRAMKEHNPDAEMIGWFYVPGHEDDTSSTAMMLNSVADWPDDCTVMFNMESGAKTKQLGKTHIVYDYTLSFAGHSRLFAQVARRVRRPGAKIQTGCSHEDASVPYIPVPSILYRKYRALQRLNVVSVMQCWYFGNYPGLMNQAAGKLSFAPLPDSEIKFLTELAQPNWKQDAPQIARAWQKLAKAYQNFPENLAFKWYGPLHHAIIFPWHLIPVNAPLPPSWILLPDRQAAGDRIGECLGFGHTLEEALRLLKRMQRQWQSGLKILNAVTAGKNLSAVCCREISVIQAIALQIVSAIHFLRFYQLRETLIFERRMELLRPMRLLVQKEIANTEQMLELCRHDCNLGYHSEAEDFLFYPENLTARIALLKMLLEEDFKKFSLDMPEVASYSGRQTTAPKVAAATSLAKAQWERVGNAGAFAVLQRKDGFQIVFREFHEPIEIDLEPSRLSCVFHASIRPERPGDSVTPWMQERGVRLATRAGLVSLTIPFRTFAGFYRENVPWRINVRSGANSWTPITETVAPRLLHSGDYRNLGWLYVTPSSVKR